MTLITKENQSVVNLPLSKLTDAQSSVSSNGTDYQLPDVPLIVIEPKKGWIPLNLRDIWQYRDLLYILTMRDIKVRYKKPCLAKLGDCSVAL